AAGWTLRALRGVCVFHRHERRLLEILLSHAGEERLVVAVERLGLGPRAIRFLRPAWILRLGLCLGQAGAEAHLLVHQRARASLGERGGASEEIEKAPGPAALGQRKGLVGVLSLKRQMNGVLIDALLGLEVAGPEARIPDLRTNVLDASHGLARCIERVLGAAKLGVRTRQAVVESGEP